jgi:hypothetical protein
VVAAVQELVVVVEKVEAAVPVAEVVQHLLTPACHVA